MEGPEIFWGSDGVALGHDEADIKGYDNFDQLAAALSKEGIDLSGGEYIASRRPTRPSTSTTTRSARRSRRTCSSTT